MFDAGRYSIPFQDLAKSDDSARRKYMPPRPYRKLSGWTFTFKNMLSTSVFFAIIVPL